VQQTQGASTKSSRANHSTSLAQNRRSDGCVHPARMRQLLQACRICFYMTGIRSRLLESIAALYPMVALIHVFLDNARYHHARLVQEWLARPACRIKLHFIPSYCPHLNPIERLWGLMHRNVTHNKCYATCAQFADATLGFLREKVPRNWANLCDSVTDNFRVINPKDFRVVT